MEPAISGTVIISRKCLDNVRFLIGGHSFFFLRNFLIKGLMGRQEGHGHLVGQHWHRLQLKRSKLVYSHFSLQSKILPILEQHFLHFRIVLRSAIPIMAKSWKIMNVCNKKMSQKLANFQA